ATIRFLDDRQQFLRVHKIGGGCVAGIVWRVFGMHGILDIGDAAHLFAPATFENGATALLRKSLFRVVANRLPGLWLHMNHRHFLQTLTPGTGYREERNISSTFFLRSSLDHITYFWPFPTA